MIQRDGRTAARRDDEALAGARVVAVDDQPTNLALLRRLLASAGIREVHSVPDPRHAVDTCLDVDADLLILDLHMPDVDGFAVMAQLQATLPPDAFLPVLVLTADATPETRREALAAGAHDFLTKPFDNIEVELRVRNLLRTAHLHASLQHQRDVLEQRVSERTRELARVNDELREIDRMKGDFVALVSHEMRTPLTVINGFAQLMGSRWAHLDENQRGRQVDAVQRSVARLDSLVGNLLRAAELENGPIVSHHAVAASVDLYPLVVEVALDADLALDDITVDCPPDVRVPIDLGALRTILSNLLTNARKYGEPPVSVVAAGDETMLEIVVSDRGAGIPPNFVERAFDQFTQASVGDRRTATGAGLGLWIARRLAQSLGGDLVYEPATPGGGFRLQLPMERPSATG